ncbi:MAG TPA: DUF488 domain-containing protein [Actinomycetota bacterium]|nr:DUF488 domain-containing protein [Actinomycetota bacterium]
MEHVPTIFTIGHGARSIEAFLSLLTGSDVRRVIDVRTAPASRKHPHFAKDALAAELERNGVEYVWRKELGGWRKPAPDSRHVALTSPGFRGYADHMASPEFRDVVTWLIETSRDTPTAVMCAESLWWRCHRRMLADALVARGCDIRHIVEGGRLQPHRLHPAARMNGQDVIYDRT